MKEETVWEVWDYATYSYYDDNPSTPAAPYMREECKSREEADKVYDYYQTTMGGDHRIIKVKRKQVRG